MRWPIWSLPRGILTWFLALESIALAVVIATPVVQPISTHDLRLLGVLAGLSLAWAELTRHNERIRRYITVGGSGPDSMPLDVWSFAALLVAPSGWAALFLACLYLQQLCHAVLDKTVPVNRVVISGAIALIAQVVAGQLTDLIHSTGTVGVLTAIGAALTFTACNLGLVMATMWFMAGRPPVRSLLPDADAISFNLACLALGLAAGVLLQHAPAAAIVILAPVALLQRGTLVAALHQAGRTDSKTGVLHSGAWQSHAQSKIDARERSDRDVAVFLVDVDNFRTANEQWGHVSADKVLKQVAATLQSVVRQVDAVGRFGGDEFAVVVDGLDVEAAHAVGERIRAAVAALAVELDSGMTATVTVSIGMAHLAADEPAIELDDLLGRADTGLYAAKREGRDLVRVAV